MRRRPHWYEDTLELENVGQTAEYLIRFTVDPGEPARGPSYSCAGEPGAPPSVDDVEVFWVDDKGQRHPRPELVDLVDFDALLESAAEDASDRRAAAMEARAEARAERDW